MNSVFMFSVLLRVPSQRLVFLSVRFISVHLYIVFCHVSDWLRTLYLDFLITEWITAFFAGEVCKAVNAPFNCDFARRFEFPGFILWIIGSSSWRPLRLTSRLTPL